jgi:hypothetical protein
MFNVKTFELLFHIFLAISTIISLNNDIKLHLKEISWEYVDWTDLAQDRDKWRALVNAVVDFPFHSTGYLLTG